jgi:DNA segregation ATPase FtsK/SpoIIIE, S-DNA-T family
MTITDDPTQGTLVTIRTFPFSMFDPVHLRIDEIGEPVYVDLAVLTHDLVARGRAAGVIIVLATQRPSHQVIDPSMRDLFGYRWAFRCTTDSSSDTVLGHGWAGEGYSAATIDPLARGVSWLLSETGVPRRIKTAYLTDRQIAELAIYAAQLRRKDTP